MSDVKKELDLLPKTMKETYTKKEMAEIITLLIDYFKRELGGIALPDFFEGISVSDEVKENFGSKSLKRKIEGVALTQIDSSISDEKQCKASKDILKTLIGCHCSNTAEYINIDLSYVCGDQNTITNRPAGRLLLKMIEILHKS
jgi:hypothetical protein